MASPMCQDIKGHPNSLMQMGNTCRNTIPCLLGLHHVAFHALMLISGGYICQQASHAPAIEVCCSSPCIQDQSKGQAGLPVCTLPVNNMNLNLGEAREIWPADALIGSEQKHSPCRTWLQGCSAGQGHGEPELPWVGGRPAQQLLQ